MVAETTQAAGLAVAAGSLGLDVRLFLAQLLNFGVVVFVMWKFVYTPLLKVLDERTGKIEKGLKDAEAAAAARAAAQEEREKTIVAARTEAKRIIEEATAAAETDRAETVKRAKAEVERIVAQGKDRLAQDKETLLADVRAVAADLVTSVAEKVLREKLDAPGDAKLVRDAIKDLA